MVEFISMAKDCLLPAFSLSMAFSFSAYLLKSFLSVAFGGRFKL